MGSTGPKWQTDELIMWHGTPGWVCQALAVIRCHTCTGTIQPGERFLRLPLSRRYALRVPVCQRCQPLAEECPDGTAAGAGPTRTENI